MSLLDKILGRPLRSTEAKKERAHCGNRGAGIGFGRVGLDRVRPGGGADNSGVAWHDRPALYADDHSRHPGVARDALSFVPADGRGLPRWRRRLHRREGQSWASRRCHCWHGVDAGLHAQCGCGNLSRRERGALGNPGASAKQITFLSARAHYADRRQPARCQANWYDIRFPGGRICGVRRSAMVIGLVRALMSGGQPQPVEPPPPVPGATEAVSAWILLRSFASGCTAMTGVEAVSNGVPLFKKPEVPRAQWTLTIIVAVLAAFLLAISYLSPAYKIHAMNEEQPGYQTIYSQLVAAVAGRGVFYYIAIASIFTILTFSAQTSFADFPRVCRLLAEDRFMPSFFAERGRRLVFSSGIITLAILAGLPLIAFGGVTDKLIPLFAIGAFSAFSFSQIGMVAHWRRKRGKHARTKLIINAVGATMTSIALVIIIVAKFVEGAWITLIVGPGLVWMFWKIKHHYEWIALEIDQPVKLQTGKLRPPVVIIPIDA